LEDEPIQGMKMELAIINRRYKIGSWLRFQKMQGVGLVGWKMCIGKYEVRLYIK